jgi:hypothetical protein
VLYAHDRSPISLDIQPYTTGRSCLCRSWKECSHASSVRRLPQQQMNHSIALTFCSDANGHDARLAVTNYPCRQMIILMPCRSQHSSLYSHQFCLRQSQVSVCRTFHPEQAHFHVKAPHQQTHTTEGKQAAPSRTLSGSRVKLRRTFLFFCPSLSHRGTSKIHSRIVTIAITITITIICGQHRYGDSNTELGARGRANPQP